MTGDHEAIQLVIQQWYRRVHAHCQSRLISPADAEDATQETFMRSFQQIAELRSPESLGAWLRGIAHHVCVDQIRRNQVRKTAPQPVEDLPPTNGDNPSENAQVTDQQEYLLKLIHQLPETLRETVLLHYYEELSYDEIARWLGVARSTVNERLSKARAMLKRDLLRDRSCPQ